MEKIKEDQHARQRSQHPDGGGDAEKGKCEEDKVENGGVGSESSQVAEVYIAHECSVDEALKWVGKDDA